MHTEDLLLDCINRRHFLKLGALCTAGLWAGCAANPVTGRSELMLISEASELELDRNNAPHQLSADYGVSQDKFLNEYVQMVGRRLVPHTHRRQMPYQFHVVNATYVNAYAFPGGTIAATRGILLKLNDEAELAGMLGHELGHVNARHTAQQMSNGMLTQVVAGGLSMVAGYYGRGYGELASRLGLLGSGALLASYSRENEREADDLGLAYMTQAGYSPEGFAGLMKMLLQMHKQKPGAFEMMFATHPMSDERYHTALSKIETQYKDEKDLPFYRERFMDHTADLRAKKTAIEAIQLGEQLMAKRQYDEAEDHLERALGVAPDDYTALVLLTKCLLLKKSDTRALQYALEAQQSYPDEAQAYHLGGFAHLRLGRYGQAYEDFSNYAKHLDGNPQTLFYQGFALEHLRQRHQAAALYIRFLQSVKQGDAARHAHRRLVQWGVIQN